VKRKKAFRLSFNNNLFTMKSPEIERFVIRNYPEVDDKGLVIYVLILD